MTREIRTLGKLQIARRDGGQSADPEFTLRGTAVTYGALSEDLGGFKEQIAPMAFSKFLAGNHDVRCLFNHSTDHVLGREKNGTLTLEDGLTSLNFRCKLDPSQQAHRDLYAAVKRGDIDACSFAFAADDDGFDEPIGADGKRFLRRTVRKAQLFDVSAVTHPAYEGSATSVVARSRVALARPVFIPPPKLSDGRLRAKADEVGEIIRVDSLRDENLRAVVYRDGKFYRDFEQEEVLARAEATRRYNDDDFEDDEPFDDLDKEDHERCAESERNLARNSKSLDEACAHYDAADAHLKAAQTGDRSDSVHAQALSFALRKKK